MESNVNRRWSCLPTARAAAWAAPFERLRDLTQARLPGTGVHLAFLELMTPRLPELVQRCWTAAWRAGRHRGAGVPGAGRPCAARPALMVEELRQQHPRCA
jgi:sirohydrochlorin cobaltochelatase